MRVAAAVLAVSILAVLDLPALDAAGLISSSVLATPSSLHRRQPWLLISRGGSDEDDDEDDSDVDNDDSEEFEEEDFVEIEVDDEVEMDEDEEEDVVMVKAAMKATEKVKAKATAATKKAVSAKMATKKRPSLVKRYVPYIIRACLNPVTVFAMTKAYFASLINLDYLAEVCFVENRACIVERSFWELTLVWNYRIHHRDCGVRWKKRLRNPGRQVADVRANEP